MCRVNSLLFISVFSLVFVITESLQAQESGVIQSSEPTTILQPEINFLAQEPIIDGILDTKLSKLPKRKFNFIAKDNPQNPAPVEINYRLAYGTHFLYLYIEVGSDSFICRDRGFQNGDGFTVAITKPCPENLPADEYYVLGFSATKDKNAFFRKVIWHHNMVFGFRGLTNETEFELKSEKNKVGFELLLPWSEVYPYHPWISEGIGFNMVFVKAIGTNDLNFHTIIKDGQRYIGDNQKERLYVNLNFENPELIRSNQTYMEMNRNCILGDSIKLKIATVSANPFIEKCQLLIKGVEGNRVKTENIEYHCNKGLTIKEYNLETSDLAPGDYQIEWKSKNGNYSGKSGLTILPTFDYATLKKQLKIICSNISSGSYNTLQFQLEQIQKQFKKLKSYEVCPELRIKLTSFLENIEKAKKGEEVYKTKAGVFRRAFRSEIDGTLQPYSVKIPKDFDPSKKYKLLVWLHGSDEDDQGQLNNRRLINKLIAIAPCGRGKRHAYTTNESQIDIQEAINDVILNYPIDTTNIILAGFSMGGYGVYRTFFETPNRYKAVAVFSGQPDLATEYFPEEVHPNFLKEKYLIPFKKTLIFIAHGKKDNNTPFHLTQEVVEKLDSLGAKVEFHIEEEMGHGTSEDARNEFYNWLEYIVNKQ